MSVDAEKSSNQEVSVGVADDETDVRRDAVFGVSDDPDVDYTSMSWYVLDSATCGLPAGICGDIARAPCAERDADIRPQAAIVLLKTQIALGVLTMPTVLSLTGGVPGALIIVVVGILTTWSDYVVGAFKRRHPEVYSMDDVGFILAGPIGREVFAIVYAILMIALVGSGLVAISIAFNAITLHATCTVAWVAIGAVVCFACASIETLHRVSVLGWIGFASVMGAILTITIAVGVQDRPVAAPATGPWDKDIHAFIDTTFLSAMSAVATVVFSYCGTPAFFNVIGEMRRPADYNKAMLTCQSIVTATYLTIGIVVYYYCGQYVTSPALGSAGPLMKRVCYGIALPGLFVSVTIYCHCGAKMLFVRLLRNSRHLTERTAVHWLVWLSTTGGSVIIAFILAEAIPFFNDLVTLVGALLGTVMCMQFNGWMWLHDNWARRKRAQPGAAFWALAALNWFLIAAGTFIMVAGTVSAVKSIQNSYATGAISNPFSCADNSASS
ncbi:hypothetical protein Q5752_006682 [Cryptotrichosporon argae]